MSLVRLADGVALNVMVSGTGEPLILLHGFTGSAASWDRHAPVFAEAGAVIAIDFLGHGLSDAPTDPGRYAMERCIADLAEVIHRLKFQGATVLGYSMGGRVALGLAVEAPATVGALILESATPGLRRASERLARIEADEALAAAIERDGIEWFVDYWQALPLWASQAKLPDHERAELKAARLRNSTAGLAASLRGLGTGRQPSYWDRLADIRAPVLLLAGALDKKYAGFARDMAALISNVRVELVGGAGHTIHLEQPEAFQRLVLDFLV